MADNPLIVNPAVYSINTFPGNGVTTVWNLNFAGGFISRTHVKAFTTGSTGTITLVTFSWISDTQIDYSPACPTGTTLTVYRDTPKDAPVVNFVDGSIINESSLDTLADQSVFASAEMVDRFSTFAAIAVAALAKSELAITASAATIGGDFTAFARTNLSNTWSAAQNLSVGSQVGGVLIATQSYVTTSIATAVAPLATSASVTAAIVTASGDATTKANAAQAAAIAAASGDATTKANTAQSAAATDATNKDTALYALIDPDWLYTLASR